MSTPGDPANWATDLSRGIDPHSAAHSALGDDLERAATPAGRQPLEASCVRAAYEAIAAAGEEVSGPDGETLVSLRSGARAAAMPSPPITAAAPVPRARSSTSSSSARVRASRSLEPGQWPPMSPASSSRTPCSSSWWMQ